MTTTQPCEFCGSTATVEVMSNGQLVSVRCQGCMGRVVPLDITTGDALRFVAHQADLCRDRDAAEALCLLLPSLMRVLAIEGMNDFEARAFRERLRRALKIAP